VLVTAIAASGWIFTKLALAAFAPSAFIALRFLLATLVLASLCLPALRRLERHQVLRALATGSLLGGTLLVWVQGIDATDNVGAGAFIVSLTVIVIPLMNRLLFGVHMTRYHVLALLPAIMGLALLSLDLESGRGLTLKADPANLLFALSTFGFALHFILTARHAISIPVMPLTTLQVFAVACMAALTSGFGEQPSLPALSLSLPWLWLLLSAVVATSLRYALQNRALGRVNTNSAAVLLLLEPVWALFLGALFLGESMRPHQLAGCLLVFSALLICRGAWLKRAWNRWRRGSGI
jgi:drug/metabolite transporter (DMT)-like permease